MERSPLQDAIPRIADGFLQYFVEHKQVENNILEADSEQVHIIEEALRTTEFRLLIDLLALLQDFQGIVNAGQDLFYNDTTQSLQSLIDRCTAHVAERDALESFRLAENLLAWLVAELHSREARCEGPVGVCEDHLNLLGSMTHHVAAI